MLTSCSPSVSQEVATWEFDPTCKPPWPAREHTLGPTSFKHPRLDPKPKSLLLRPEPGTRKTHSRAQGQKSGNFALQGVLQGLGSFMIIITITSGNNASMLPRSPEIQGLGFRLSQRNAGAGRILRSGPVHGFIPTGDLERTEYCMESQGKEHIPLD